jgi:protein-disulfide isomerase
MNFVRWKVWQSVLGLGALAIVGSATPAARAVEVAAKAPAVSVTRTISGQRTGVANESYKDIAVGFTPEGYPYRGSPDAPITLTEYSDYLCPFCESFFRQTMPALLEKHVRSGQVKFVVRDLPLATLHPTAPKGALAAMCAAEQGADRFWRVHDALFQTQPQWQRMPDPSEHLAEIVRKTGADMKAYEQCIASSEARVRVQTSIADAQGLGFSGTPSFQFANRANGKQYSLVGAQSAEVFSRWIEQLLAGNDPPESQPADKPPELPNWAKPEGLAPDPKRPGYTIAGDPYLGSPDAKLVLVEFVDFECPACQRHALATRSLLDKRFIVPGDVMWVVKNFPLGVHARAPVAAAAAECAGEQGRFFRMHDLLFERLDDWSKAVDPDAALRTLASKLELNDQRFRACLQGRNAMERVLRDIYDGQAVNVRNLPLFILLHSGRGHVLTGARPAEEFAAAIQQQLDRAKADRTTAGLAAR